MKYATRYAYSRQVAEMRTWSQLAETTFVPSSKIPAEFTLELCPCKVCFRAPIVMPYMRRAGLRSPRLASCHLAKMRPTARKRCDEQVYHRNQTPAQPPRCPGTLSLISTISTSSQAEVSNWSLQMYLACHPGATTPTLL